MLGNRRNVVFRLSIVINVAVLFYAAMQLSSPSEEWVPVTAAGDQRGPAKDDAQAQYRLIRNDTLSWMSSAISASGRIMTLGETTSQKIPSTIPSSNKTITSSTTSFIETESMNDTMYELDDSIVSDSTIGRLRTLLDCHDRDFLPKTFQRGEFLVLMNFVRAAHGGLQCHETVTYTTHAEFEFLDNIQPLVERWMAPISLSIHAPGSDFAEAVASIRYLRDCLGSDLVRQFVTFHLFFAYKNIPSQIPNPSSFLDVPYNCSLNPPYESVNTSTTFKAKKNILYPVNVARNIARDAALTHFILPSDIELYPSPSLVPRFLNMIARNEPPLSNSSHPRIFPISIFEVDGKAKLPSTKTELKSMLQKKTAIPFHKYVCPYCHNIPQGQQWMSANETNRMDVFHVGKRQGKYQHWEPIFIGTHQDPYYDERLSWEGKKDKMTQGYILCVKDYDFMILNDAFLCHKPGIKRYVKNRKRDLMAARQGAFVSKIIMPELKKLYGTRKGCAV